MNMQEEMKFSISFFKQLLTKISVQSLQEGRTEETEIFATSKRGTKIDRSGSRRSGNSSKYNAGRPVHLLFDQYQSSGDSREYLFQHLEQLSRWIMLLETNPTYLP